MNIFAIILIMGSSVALALFFIRKELKHCAGLDDAVRLVEYISGRAIHFGEPLSEILEIQNEDARKLIIRLRENFKEQLDNSCEIPDSWETAVNNTFCDVLEDYECDVLIHFGKNLCRCSHYEIEGLKRKAVSDLEDFRNTAIENKKTKTKSTAAITVSAGVIIVLMFA